MKSIDRYIGYICSLTLLGFVCVANSEALRAMQAPSLVSTAASKVQAPVEAVNGSAIQPFGGGYEDAVTASQIIQPADYSKQTTTNGLFLQDASAKIQGGDFDE